MVSELEPTLRKLMNDCIGLHENKIWEEVRVRYGQSAEEMRRFVHKMLIRWVTKRRGEG